MRGNGVGSGLRSAILAAAVLEAAGGDIPPQSCFDHYTQRLRDTMRAHVRNCVDFYRRAAHAVGWSAEIDAMAQALHQLPSGPSMASLMLNDGYLCRAPGAIGSVGGARAT